MENTDNYYGIKNITDRYQNTKRKKFYPIIYEKMNETKSIEGMVELYRKILGDEYKNTDDADIVLLANRIKGFCHAIINSHPKDFSDKRKLRLLSFQSEKNE